MEPSTRPRPVDRLTELVTLLTGTHGDTVREAVADAVDRHGDWGDGLLNVAEALVALRHLADTGVHPREEPARFSL